MTSCSRGDIVLCSSSSPTRRASSNGPPGSSARTVAIGGRRETILAAITSNVGRLLVGDYKIKAWRESGLLYPSIVTGIVRTIKQDMIAGKMGDLPASELHAVEDKLREILAL